MSAAERAYRLLLRAYPAKFRATFGREMSLVFRDRRRDAGARGARFWAEMIWDVARSAPALRLEALRAPWDRDIQTEEGTMKPMAILAILIGAFEALNALAELWAGGLVNHDGHSLAWGIVGVVAGVLLLVSGIALLRRTPAAAAWARGASITCLAVFVLIGVVQPRFSMLAMMLGIGFPIALLIFLRWTGGRGARGPIVA